MTFVENRNYMPHETSAALSISKFTPAVNITIDNVVYGTNATVVSNVTGLNGTILSTDYKVVDADNKTVELSNKLPVGTYTVIVDYAGNQNYTAVKGTHDFTVSEASH